MTPSRILGIPILAVYVVAAFSMYAAPGQAALTDLSDNPLASSTTSSVKPNVLFTLDDSGSMDWEYMPDDLSSRTGRIGFRNNSCNLVYYNPAITYVVPKTSSGGSINTAVPTTFTAAYDEGFYSYMSGGSSTTRNLSTTGFKAHGSDTGQPAYYWTYLGATTLTPLTGDCEKSLPSSSDSTAKEYCTDGTTTTTTCAAAGKTALWRKVIVGANTGPGGTDERQNFANWYSYYSTRIKMMKSAAGRAFVTLDDSYRIGFITINPGSPVSSNKFETIADFDATQKANWYSKLYSQATGSSTPLRTALSRAGRYFAGKTDGINNGMTGDPVQYSCQQNFVILTTDGYWNGTGGYKLDGTAMSDTADNQDGNVAELDSYNPTGSKFAVSPRPIYDGATALYTWNTASNTYRDTTCNVTRTQVRTVQWQSQPVTLQKQILQLQARTGTAQTRTNQLQRSTSNLQTRTASLQEQTASVQLSTGQLQSQTATLQEQTASVQLRTGQLQKRTWKLQKRESSNSGSTWTVLAPAPGWVDAASCQWDTGGSSRRQCQYVLVTDWANSATCTAVAQSSGSSGGTNWTVQNATDCQYTWGAYANAGACTPTAAATVAAYGVQNPTQCQYGSYSGWSNVGSCQAVAQSTGTGSAWNATARNCQYTAYTAWGNAASCTPAAKSSGSGNWTVGTATNCQYTWGAYANAGACTPTAAATVAAYGVQNPTQCQYGSYSGWSNVGSCQAVAQSTGTGSAWNATARNCQYTAYTAWANAASCTAASKSTGSGNWTVGTAADCQYTAWSSYAGSQTCTAEAQSGASPYTVGTAVQCQYSNPSWNNVSSGQTCTATSPNASGNFTECSVNWGSWSNVSSCTSDSLGSTWRECQTTDTGWLAAASCSQGTNGSGQTTNCQSLVGGPWTNTTGPCVSSDSLACQAVGIAPNPTWTDQSPCTAVATNGSGQETQCQSVVDSTGKKNQYQATTTATNYSGPNRAGSIVGTPTTTTGAWTDITGTCFVSGSQPALPANGTVTGGGPPAPPSGCTSGSQVWPCETAGAATGGTSNTLADVAQYYYKTDLRPGNIAVASTDAAYGKCPGGGALGGSVDVCENNVPASGTAAEDDKASWQHMTTFTMGLGLSGCLNYVTNYKTATTGAFANIRTGASNTSTNTDSDCTGAGRSPFSSWPAPVHDQPSALDDLWHAAVNGRGEYFSAGNPDSVISSLGGALAGVNARVASAASAATSTQQPVNGDNFAFTAKYVTQKWTGDLEMHEIDLTTGAVQGAVVWSAQALLDGKGKNSCDNRVIKLFHSGATNNLVDFTWNSFACDAAGSPTGSASNGLDGSEKTNFGAAQIVNLSQYPTMTDGITPAGSADQRTEAAGANLVNYIRGQRGAEGFVSNTTGKLFRTRDHILGDIINAQPIYVKKPFNEYDDSGYATFKADNVGRTPMVYTAANDGMLHAFYAGTSIIDPNGGQEAWAFIPSMVLPNLYKMASVAYETQHAYSVDGTPTVGDIYDSTDLQWKTILVGGLNKGGKGYYALDVTDPATPKALWEFKLSATCFDSAVSSTWTSDCNLGYSFGNPLISKLRDGRWVVFVTSGLNNVNSPAAAGDGVGYLYVLNAVTGEIIYKIGTGVGSSASPSGLTKIANWIDHDPSRNNQTERVYGVDLLGNVWRFDVNDILGAAGREASLVATVVDEFNVPQAITTKPVLTKIDNTTRIYFGTGRYLGVTDLSGPLNSSGRIQTQTVWSLRDTLGATPLSSLRTTLAQNVLVDSGSGSSAQRIVYCAAQCGADDGWFSDLPVEGERVSVGVVLGSGTLTVASNTPVSNACNVGGTSRKLDLGLNGLSIGAESPPKGGSSSLSGDTLTIKDSTGTTVKTEADVKAKNIVSTGVFSSPIVGINRIRLPGGKVVDVVTFADGHQESVEVPVNTLPPTGKRVSWREVIQ